MITINDEEYRNLQEQVLKNQCDIQAMKFGLKVVGFVDTVPELPSDIEIGEAIGVGESYPYYFYIKVGEPKIYANVGTLQGVRGYEGPMGHEGIQGVDGTKWLYGYGEPSMSAREGDLYIDTQTGNVFAYDLKNAWIPITHLKGPQGPIGLQGPRGPQGPQGPKGDKGDYGAPIKIIGKADSVSKLPNPNLVPTNSAYLVGTSTTGYDLYAIVGIDSKVWENLGPYSTVDKEYVDSKSMLPTQTIIKNVIQYADNEQIGTIKEYIAPSNGYFYTRLARIGGTDFCNQINALSLTFQTSSTGNYLDYKPLIPCNKGTKIVMFFENRNNLVKKGNLILETAFIVAE